MTKIYHLCLTVIPLNPLAFSKTQTIKIPPKGRFSSKLFLPIPKTRIGKETPTWIEDTANQSVENIHSTPTMIGTPPTNPLPNEVIFNTHNGEYERLEREETRFGTLGTQRKTKTMSSIERYYLREPRELY